MKIISKNLLLYAFLLLVYSVLHFILFLVLRKGTIKGVHKADIFE